MQAWRPLAVSRQRRPQLTSLSMRQRLVSGAHSTFIASHLAKVAFLPPLHLSITEAVVLSPLERLRFAAVPCLPPPQKAAQKVAQPDCFHCSAASQQDALAAAVLAGDLHSAGEHAANSRAEHAAARCCPLGCRHSPLPPVGRPRLCPSPPPRPCPLPLARCSLRSWAAACTS